jgi:bacterial/archaeal transporter family protein
MSAFSAFTWAILASFCWGLAPLLEKAGLRGGTDPAVGVFVRSLGVTLGAVCFLPLFYRWPGRLSQVTPHSWIYLCSGGLMASILGQLCFYRALKIGDVSRVVPVGASYPVTACLLGILILREPLTLAKGIGILLVVSGTFLLR